MHRHTHTDNGLIRKFKTPLLNRGAKPADGSEGIQLAPVGGRKRRREKEGFFFCCLLPYWNILVFIFRPGDNGAHASLTVLRARVYNNIACAALHTAVHTGHDDTKCNCVAYDDNGRRERERRNKKRKRIDLPRVYILFNDNRPFVCTSRDGVYTRDGQTIDRRRFQSRSRRNLLSGHGHNHYRCTLGNNGKKQFLRKSVLKVKVYIFSLPKKIWSRLVYTTGF